MAFRVETSPQKALHLSQGAVSTLSSTTTSPARYPWTLLEKPESLTIWTECERLFVACLTTGDDKAAHFCLERLSSRFGVSDPRVMGLRGMYQESSATNSAELERVLQSYEKILQVEAMNKPIAKRRIAVKKSLSRPKEAIEALVEFLLWNATDAEAWCELADLYLAQGMASQAIFSLEEALLVAPNAWNLHVRLGEIEYIGARSPGENSENSQRLLANSIRRFGRSIELCDDYLRGYYGLKLATNALLASLKTNPGHRSDEIPSAAVLEQLKKLARGKLEVIVKTRKSKPHLSDASRAELKAVQELLDASD